MTMPQGKEDWWTVRYRTSREALAAFLSTFIMCFLMVFLRQWFEWSSPAYLGIVVPVFVLSIAGWLAWQRWGRAAFPLRSPSDDSI